MTATTRALVLAALGVCIPAVSSAAPMVLDLTPGAAATFSTPGILPIETEAPRSYFMGVNSAGIRRVFETDATLAGTRSVDDATYTMTFGFVGVTSLGPIYRVDDAMYLFDGARKPLFTAPVGSAGFRAFDASATLVFLYAFKDFNGYLWATDGTATGTRALTMSAFNYAPTVLAGRAYVVTKTGTVEVTDGTTVSPALGGWGGANTAESPAACNGKLFIATTDGLAVSDGTAAPTVLVSGMSPSPRSLACAGTKLFFYGSKGTGLEPWISDGSAAGTKLLRDIRPGSVGQSTNSGYLGPDRMYFYADDGVHGRELWFTDGTEAGTVLVTDFATGMPSSSLSILTQTAVAGLLPFRYSTKLYVADGARLYDATPMFGGVPLPPADPSTVGRANNHLFYLGETTATGRELVVFDPRDVPAAADAGDAGDAGEAGDVATSDVATDSGGGVDSAVEDAADDAPSVGAEDAAVDAGEIPSSSSSDDSGCGCRTAGSNTSSTLGLVGLAVAIALARTRRRAS